MENNLEDLLKEREILQDSLSKLDEKISVTRSLINNKTYLRKYFKFKNYGNRYLYFIKYEVNRNNYSCDYIYISETGNSLNFESNYLINTSTLNESVEITKEEYLEGLNTIISYFSQK